MTEQLQEDRNTLATREIYVGLHDDEVTLSLRVPEQPIEGKLSKDHKKLLQQNWEVIRDYAGGADADYGSLKGCAEQVVKSLGDSRFDRSMKLSVEKRLEAVGRVKWLSELESSNSPWRKVIDLAKDRLHGIDRNKAQDKVLENYMATSILALKGRMEKAGVNTVEMEDKIVGMYMSYLNRLTRGDVGETKFKDILLQEDEIQGGRGATVGVMFERLKKEIEEEKVKDSVPDISLDDIPDGDGEFSFDDEEFDFRGLDLGEESGDEEWDFDFDLDSDDLEGGSPRGEEIVWQLDLGVVRDKIAGAREGITDWIREANGRLKLSPQSVVQDVLANVKNILPERGELIRGVRNVGVQAAVGVDKALDLVKNRIPGQEELRKAGRKTAKIGGRVMILGAAVAALHGPMDTGGQTQRAETTAQPAGTPGNVLEVESPNVSQMLGGQVAQAEEPSDTQSSRGNEPQYIRSDAYAAAIEDALARQRAFESTSETMEEQTNESVGPAQEIIQEMAQSTQETPDYSRIKQILTERGYEFEVRNGVPSWKPKVGQYWSHFLGEGLGFRNPDVYGETGSGGLLDQYDLRNKSEKPLKAGEWVPVPAGLFQTSSE